MLLTGKGTEFLHGIELISPNILKIIAISQLGIMYLQPFKIICKDFSEVPHHCGISAFNAIIQTRLLRYAHCKGRERHTTNFSFKPNIYKGH